jgi:hypothetical protein
MTKETDSRKLLNMLRKKRKLLLWLGWLTGIVLVLATILSVLASRYINSEPAQNNIREVVTQQLGEMVTYQRAYLSLFPRPGLAFSQVVITIPQTTAISAQSASIYPELLPLLIGKVRLAKLKLEAPDITINIPEKSEKEKQAKPASFNETVADIDSVLASIRTAVPGLVCVLHRGKLLVREAGQDEITAQDINARIALVPTGIEISFKGDVERWERVSAKGKFYTEGNNILINDLSVSTGKSLVSIFSAKLRLEDKPILEIASGKAVVILDDIYERRSSLVSLYDPLLKMKKLKGVVKVESLKLFGELLHPEKWIVETAGSVEDIDVDFSELPSPVKIEHGQFKRNKSTVTLSNVQASIFDSSFTASAVISWSVQAIDSADVFMNGKMGPEAVRWVSKTFKLPPEHTVRAPLSISNAHIVWQAGSNLAITGIAAIKNGPTISLDLRKYGEELAIKQLIIRDEDSNAAITLVYGKNLVDFSFRGSLTEKALNRVFARTSFQHGWIKGDLRAHIHLDKPGASSAQGYLEGANLIVPRGANEPLKIGHANLRADNKTLKVDSATVSFADNHFALKGELKALKNIFRLDMDASNDGINVDALKQTLADKNNPEQPQPKEFSKKNSVLQGIVRLKTKSVTWGRYTISPVSADILFDQKGVRAATTDAALCGISVPGNLRFADDYIQLDFKPTATAAQLEPALTCLWGKDLRISGIMDLKAGIKAKGKSNKLVSALQGKVDFRAKDGCIYRFPLLAKILSFLNMTELLRGKVPNLGAKGLDYNSIIIQGDLRNGKFVISEAIIDGTTMQLVGQGEIDISNNKVNLTVLVAPFKTVDYLVNKIPLIGYVLKGTLVSIPLSITGKLDDPTIIILSPTAIGKGVLGIMTRTLLLPVKIIEPFIPRNKEKEQ